MKNDFKKCGTTLCGGKIVQVYECHHCEYRSVSLAPHDCDFYLKLKKDAEAKNGNL